MQTPGSPPLGARPLARRSRPHPPDNVSRRCTRAQCAHLASFKLRLELHTCASGLSSGVFYCGNCAGTSTIDVCGSSSPKELNQPGVVNSKVRLKCSRTIGRLTSARVQAIPPRELPKYNWIHSQVLFTSRSSKKCRSMFYMSKCGPLRPKPKVYKCMYDVKMCKTAKRREQIG
ncbi:hypothetical protein B0H11DRAFT_640960 [Mycena galericulata]|nr:hypothetical protein B0H11DRAFT_640960 [Mycena galericulata]